ncbi:MAG: helix-turn-helix domain-containing protein [Luteibaculaceae bacterium]
MDNSERFITKKPNAEIIARYISYYYFHQNFEKNRVQRIIFYPNTINAVTIYRNSVVVFKNKYISTTKPSVNEGFNLFYSGIKTQIGISEMESPFDKIGIAFEPLGIHRFINKPYQEILSKNEDCVFTEFNEDIFPTLEKVYATLDVNEKVKILDEYFLTRLTNFNEKIIEKAVELITKSHQKYKVYELASGLKTSTKTLNRKFYQYLNCSAKEYLEVSQFRKSFNHFLVGANKENLTSLAHYYNYYDQSEFIRHYRKIAGSTPKKLFQSVKHFGEEHIFWGK